MHAPTLVGGWSVLRRRRVWRDHPRRWPGCPSIAAKLTWLSPPCSALALGVKLTLDQVLGFALWHAALAGVSEPHRQACLALLLPLVPLQQLQQQLALPQQPRGKQGAPAASQRAVMRRSATARGVRMRARCCASAPL